MLKINLVQPLKEITSFTNPFEFEIDFDCLRDVEIELEWNAHLIMQNSRYNYHLDRILMGPISSGRHIFNFRVDPPDYNSIPQEEWIKNMIVLICCHYKSQEYLRIGYIVHHEYSEGFGSSCTYDDKLNPNLVLRIIKTDESDFSTFPISWD